MMGIIKNKFKTEYLILFLFFLFVLGFRLYFAFQTNHFNTDGAYFHLRHIQYFLEEKSPLTYDNLSYGGREVLYPPLFHVIMAFLSFGSIILLKLIPEIFISLTIFIVYGISKYISDDPYVPIFSAVLSSFFPILFGETLNNLSVYTLVVPLLLVMIYSLLRLDEKFYLWLFIICSFLLPLLHSS
ncbi:hypothetical protein HYU23_00020 [Candidatus Woesearchaeota archaeon]|nr:hypothetical protein [Candidatus Woesearchaeota archaeon]